MIIINKYLNADSILTHFCMFYVTIPERAAFNLLYFCFASLFFFFSLTSWRVKALL